jgi:hypothetical protein
LIVTVNARSSNSVPTDARIVKLDPVDEPEPSEDVPLIVPLLVFKLPPDGNEPDCNEYDIVPLPTVVAVT